MNRIDRLAIAFAAVLFAGTVAPLLYAQTAGPVLMADMQRTLDLVSLDKATAVTVQAGDWNDPATWKDGRLPVDGDRVAVLHNFVARSTPRLKTLYINAKPSFDGSAPDPEDPPPDPDPEPEPDPDPTPDPEPEPGPTPLERISTIERLLSEMAAEVAKLKADLTPQPMMAAGGPAPVVITAETFIAGMESDISTPEDFAGQIDFVCADFGAPNPVEDPYALGKGWIFLGKVDLHGRKVTGWQYIVGNKAGESSITLKNEVIGWRVGDKLVVPGTGVAWETSQALKDDDDVCTIAAINGNTITLAEPLKFDHSATNRYGKPRPMFVANISPRGIDFSSENAAPDRRGHVMVMRDDLMMQQDFFYCSFRDCGRTDKSRAVTDPDGKGNGLNNPRARYALHYHRCKPDRWIDAARTIPAMEARVFGCMVHSSPGWGFVNHDSFVCMQHNVAYDVWGAHYSCEIGTESGCFTGDVAIRSRSTSGQKSASEVRFNRNDWGRHGHGIWTHAGNVKCEGNIVTGVPNTAYDFMGEGFNDGDAGQTGFVMFATKNLSPGDAITSKYWNATATTVSPSWVPQRHKGLACFGCGNIGVQFWGINPIKQTQPVIANGSLADCYLECPIGLKYGYSSFIDLSNVTHCCTPTVINSGVGFTHNGGAGSNTFIRFATFGASVGFNSPIEGTVSLTDSLLDAKANGLVIQMPADTTRKLTLANLTFGDSPVTIHARMKTVDKLSIVEGGGGGWMRAINPIGHGTAALGDATTLDGKFLYYAEEAPDFAMSNYKPAVVDGGRKPSVPMPALLAEKTVKQLRDEFKIGILNRYGADDMQPVPKSNALVGSPPKTLPLLRVCKDFRQWPLQLQHQKTNVVNDFVLKVQEGVYDYGKVGAWVESPPVTLNDKAWNVVKVQASGVERGVLVYCDSAGSVYGW